MQEEIKKTIYEIRPKDLILKENETVSLLVMQVMPDGTEIRVNNDRLRWKDSGKGAYIDQYGIMLAIEAGEYPFYVYLKPEGEDIKGEIVLTDTVSVLKTPIEKSLNTAFSDARDGIMEERIETENVAMPPIQKVTLKKITVEQLKERAQERKPTFMGHTRAITRTIGANKDLIWLGSLAIFAMIFGGCLVLLLSGITIEKIGTFLTMLVGVIISFFGKLYAPPGEVTEAISVKMQGTNDHERLKSLTEKKEKLETRINELSTKIQGKTVQNPSFYKMTMDESVI